MKINLSDLATVLAAQRRGLQPSSPRKKTSTTQPEEYPAVRAAAKK